MAPVLRPPPILHSKLLGAARFFANPILYMHTDPRNFRLQRSAPLSDAASIPAVGPSHSPLGETLARIIARSRMSTTSRGILMESSITNNLSKTSQALVDKAADRAQGGIRDAQQAAKDAGSALSGRFEEYRRDAGSALTKAVDRVQSIGKQAVDAVTDAAERTRDVATDTAGSIVRYTKKNPMTALMIAAASGALLLSLIKVLRPSRD
jgi:ElaB/YqjD/DUF883 family membrane-anchored ribosome-binding protein